MKNNFFSSKKPKIGALALLFLFCGLFSQTAVAQAQATFTWKTTGGVDNSWTTPGNWTKSGTTTGAGSADTYPGETPGRRFDIAIVATGATAVTPAIPARVDAYSVYRLDINNSATVPAGAVVTVDNGATLNVGDQNSNQIRLAGGTLINNGAVNTSSTAVGSTGFPITGIICLTPTSIPTGATEYGYKGSGTLSISMPNANLANAACFYSNGTSTNANIVNATYKLVLNNPTLSYNQATILAIGAIRTIGITNASHYAPKLVISGTGITIGTSDAPYIGSLIGIGAGTDVTVDSATTLTFHSKDTNTSAIVTSFSASAVSGLFTSTTLNLTNKGTINILGASARSGFSFATGGTATNRSIITNEGTVTVNLICSRSQDGAFATADGGGSHLDNSCRLINSGTMSLTNSLGSAIYASQSFNSPPLILTNSGTLNLEGAMLSGSPTFVNNPNIKGYINNTGLINTNNELGNVVFTNSSTGTIAFANAAAGATTNGLATGTFAINDGKILTGSAKMNTLGLIAAYSATSSIEPGGTGKGIADFNKAAAIVLGKLVVQVDGNTVAGTDFDQVKNSFTDGGFDVTGATLDVTSISGTASPVDIIVANGAGTIAGPFQNVTGLSSGWSVNYGVAGKVQLVYSAPVNTWTGATNTSWTNAGNWSAGAPISTSDVVIVATANQPVIGSNVTINSLTINSSASVMVNSTFSLTVTNAIINNGTLTVANNANLVQTAVANTNSGSGTATVNRNSAALKRLDYTMWSSPVSGTQTLADFSPNTSRTPNRFYTYNSATDVYSNILTTSVFTPGMGYLIRMPNDASTSATEFAGSFTGTSFNNGTINLGTLVANKFYSVGNPYASPISASSFIAGTSGLGTTLYFWRKTNGVANTLSGSSTGTSYATWTSMGGVASGVDAPNNIEPNGQIAVGQGFIVNTGSATTINFTNAMRTSTAANFLKTKAATTPDRIWLNLTNTTGAFSQTLIGYTTNATLGVDNGIDGEYINDSSLALTSNINNKEYTIQGRPTFDPTDVVALNFKTGVAGDYSIALDHFDGIFAGAQDVYLVDSKTGAETDLKAGSYTFNAAIGTDNTRFSLKFQKTLKVIDATLDNNSVSVYQNNGAIYINSKSAAIRSVKVFDVQGRLIAEQRNVNANTALFSNLKAKNQLLIVNVIGEDNSEVSKKVMN